MTEKLTAIVLYVMRYSDKNSIAHLLTLERGRVALLLPQGSTAAARRRNALFMPLSLVDVEAVSRAGKEMMNLREVSARDVLAELHLDPVKNALALFVAELLSKVTIDREDNGELFAFAENAVMLLARQQRGVANFHLCFLMKLAIMLGISPDEAGYREGYGFDMREGEFRPFDRLVPTMLPPGDAAVLVRLCRMSFATMHRYRYSRHERTHILELILQYYRLHNSIVGEMKTLPILSSLFD